MHEQSDKKGQVGCLLIHGFTGSPEELSDLGDFLAGQGISVSLPILPGHGTHSADLFNYTWHDWFSCVKSAYLKLKGECKEIFVCGLSMGGTLALLLAAHEFVQGVMVLSAVVEFPKWQKMGVRVFKNVAKFRYKSNGSDIRDLSAKGRSSNYLRYPYYAIDQLFELVEHTRNELGEIEVPVLIIHSRKDHTINFSNSETIYRLINSKEKRKIDLEESYHIITVDVEKEVVKQEVLRFIQQYSTMR